MATESTVDESFLVNLQLASEPLSGAQQSIYVYSEDPKLSIVGPQSLFIFNQSNWNTPQTVTIKSTEAGIKNLKYYITANHTCEFKSGAVQLNILSGSYGDFYLGGVASQGFTVEPNKYYVFGDITAVYRKLYNYAVLNSSFIDININNSNLKCVDNTVVNMVEEVDNGMYIVGDFYDDLQDITRNTITHITEDKAIDPNFISPVFSGPLYYIPDYKYSVYQYNPIDTYVREIEVDNSYMYVTGIFTSISGAAYNGFVQLDKSTGAISQNPIIESISGAQPTRIAIDDTYIYLGSSHSDYSTFSKINEIPKKYVAAINKTTGDVSDFGIIELGQTPTVNGGNIQQIVPTNDGIYCLGQFNYVYMETNSTSASNTLWYTKETLQSSYSTPQKYGLGLATSKDNNLVAIANPSSTNHSVDVYTMSGGTLELIQSITQNITGFSSSETYGKIIKFSSDSQKLLFSDYFRNRVYIYKLNNGLFELEHAVGTLPTNRDFFFGYQFEINAANNLLFVTAPYTDVDLDVYGTSLGSGQLFVYALSGGDWVNTANFSSHQYSPQYQKTNILYGYKLKLNPSQTLAYVLEPQFGEPVPEQFLYTYAISGQNVTYYRDYTDYRLNDYTYCNSKGIVPNQVLVGPVSGGWELYYGLGGAADFDFMDDNTLLYPQCPYAPLTGSDDNISVQIVNISGDNFNSIGSIQVPESITEEYSHFARYIHLSKERTYLTIAAPTIRKLYNYNLINGTWVPESNPTSSPSVGYNDTSIDSFGVNVQFTSNNKFMFVSDPYRSSSFSFPNYNYSGYVFYYIKSGRYERNRGFALKHPNNWTIGGYSENLLDWNPKLDNGTIYSLSYKENYVFIGGDFTTIDGVSKNKVAKYANLLTYTGETSADLYDWSVNVGSNNITTVKHIADNVVCNYGTLTASGSGSVLVVYNTLLDFLGQESYYRVSSIGSKNDEVNLFGRFYQMKQGSQRRGGAAFQYNENGQLYLMNFDPEIVSNDEYPNACQIGNTNQVFIVGKFSTIKGQKRNGIAILDMDEYGTLTPYTSTLGLSAAGFIYPVFYYNDYIYYEKYKIDPVTGTYSDIFTTSGYEFQHISKHENYLYFCTFGNTINGQYKSGIFSWNLDTSTFGSLDVPFPTISSNRNSYEINNTYSEFNFGVGATVIIRSIVSDGEYIYVCGKFDAIDDYPRNGLIKIKISDNTISSWDPNLNINNPFFSYSDLGGNQEVLALNGNNLYLYGCKKECDLQQQIKSNLICINKTGNGSIIPWVNRNETDIYISPFTSNRYSIGTITLDVLNDNFINHNGVYISLTPDQAQSETENSINEIYVNNIFPYYYLSNEYFTVSSYGLFSVNDWVDSNDRTYYKITLPKNPGIYTYTVSVSSNSSDVYFWNGSSWNSTWSNDYDSSNWDVPNIFTVKSVSTYEPYTITFKTVNTTTGFVHLSRSGVIYPRFDQLYDENNYLYDYSSFFDNIIKIDNVNTETYSFYRVLRNEFWSGGVMSGQDGYFVIYIDFSTQPPLLVNFRSSTVKINFTVDTDDITLYTGEYDIYSGKTYNELAMQDNKNSWNNSTLDPNFYFTVGAQVIMVRYTAPTSGWKKVTYTLELQGYTDADVYWSGTNKVIMSKGDFWVEIL
jgi:hypothetical protein